MRGYIRRCGHMARMFTIGNSKQGQSMWALEISNKPGHTEAKPSARYVGNMHGDEPASRCPPIVGLCSSLRGTKPNALCVCARLCHTP